MAEEKRKVSNPKMPDIQKCPRCGTPILIGDIRCTNCGYNLQTFEGFVREQPPLLIAGGLFMVGVVLAIAALTGMEGALQVVFLLLGSGLVVSGGLYYAADLLLFNADDRRKK